MLLNGCNESVKFGENNMTVEFRFAVKNKQKKLVINLSHL